MSPGLRPVWRGAEGEIPIEAKFKLIAQSARASLPQLTIGEPLQEKLKANELGVASGEFGNIGMIGALEGARPI